jgi:hypothetical protein
MIKGKITIHDANTATFIEMEITAKGIKCFTKKALKFKDIYQKMSTFKADMETIINNIQEQVNDSDDNDKEKRDNLLKDETNAIGWLTNSKDYIVPNGLKKYLKAF